MYWCQTNLQPANSFVLSTKNADFKYDISQPTNPLHSSLLQLALIANRLQLIWLVALQLWKPSSCRPTQQGTLHLDQRIGGYRQTNETESSRCIRMYVHLWISKMYIYDCCVTVYRYINIYIHVLFQKLLMYASYVFIDDSVHPYVWFYM